MTHVVCMGSTYEDDCEEGDDIILCDGCNAEAHIRCLNMKVVRYVTLYCVISLFVVLLHHGALCHTLYYAIVSHVTSTYFLLY
jgi:hypothetical protein